MFIEQHFTNLVSNNNHRVWQKGLFCTGWLDHSVHMATGSTAEFNRYAGQGLFNARPLQKQICTLKICILFSWHASKCDELTFHFPRTWMLSTVVIFPSRFLGTQGKNAHHLHYIQVHFWAKKFGFSFPLPGKTGRQLCLVAPASGKTWEENSSLVFSRAAIQPTIHASRLNRWSS